MLKSHQFFFYRDCKVNKLSFLRLNFHTTYITLQLGFMDKVKKEFNI